MQETVISSRISSEPAATPETVAQLKRRAYSAPKLVELGTVQELTAGDAGANPDLGTTRFA